MAARLHFVVEGQTEEAFVKTVLAPHLWSLSVFSNVSCVATSLKRGVKHRGGVNNYHQVKNDIVRWMREDANSDARFTTMLDLYALPASFPGYESASRLPPLQRVEALESALKEDIGDWRFIPYIQLHEFEALLLSDPQKLGAHFQLGDDAIRRLADMASCFQSPELINDGSETAPSKRIIAEIPEYSGAKASDGPIVANRIGLGALRANCRHFGDWLDKLEHLGPSR